MTYTYSEVTVLAVTVVRKAYGGVHIALCSRKLEAAFATACNTAGIAVMAPEEP